MGMKKRLKGLHMRSIRVKLVSSFLLVSILPMVVMMVAGLSYSSSSLKKGISKRLIDNRHGLDIELQDQEKQLLLEVRRNAKLPVLLQVLRSRDPAAMQELLSQILVLSQSELVGLYDETGSPLLHLQRSVPLQTAGRARTALVQEKMPNSRHFEWLSSAHAQLAASQDDDFSFGEDLPNSGPTQNEAAESGLHSITIEGIPLDLMKKIREQEGTLQRVSQEETIRISAFHSVIFDGRPIGILHQAIELGKSFAVHLKEKTGLDIVLLGADGKVIVSTLSDVGMFSMNGGEGFLNDTERISELDDYLYSVLALSQEAGRIKGGIGLFQSLDLYRSGQRELTLFFAILFVVSTIIVTVVTFFVAGSLSQPIQRITDAVLKVADREGDLTLRLPVQSEDEVGQLANSFNIMTQSFRGLIFGVREVGFQMSAQASDISEGVNQQASGASQQSSTVAAVTSTVEELSETATLIAANALNLARSADETLKGMEETKAKVDEVSKNVMSLGEKSKAVGNITNLIEDLADRTNLLALNASIEAARAGEAGHGFAVVAVEVGKLAEQSAQSTNDIRKLIHEIQAEISSTVIGVEETTQKTDRGLQMVSETVEVIKQISISTQQQKSGAEHVVEAIMNIDDVTASFATTTQETATHATELSQLAIKLKSAISGFNIGDNQGDVKNQADEDDSTILF